MPQMGVYAVTCTPTSEQYVGQSVDITTRWETHRTRLTQGTHARLVQEAWNLYGADGFTWEVLENVADRRLLSARNAHYISSLRPALNRQPPNASRSNQNDRSG